MDRPIRAVVVGSINRDLILSVRALPHPGETILGRSVREAPGGKGANQAVALARLGAAVTMIGHVGDDDFGRSGKAELNAEGISTATVTMSSAAPSGLAVVAVDDAGENLIVVIPGANAELTPAHAATPLASAALLAADLVVLQLEIPMDTVAAAAAAGRAAGSLVVLNCAPAAELPRDLYANTDVLVLNETEAATLAGVADPVAAARLLTSLGPRLVIVTLGSAGCIAVAADGSTPVRQRSYPVPVLDTTGAGDCFVAAVGLALAQRADTAAALRIAAMASALAVTVSGAQAGMPARAAVDAALSGAD